MTPIQRIQVLLRSLRKVLMHSHKDGANAGLTVFPDCSSNNARLLAIQALLLIDHIII